MHLLPFGESSGSLAYPQGRTSGFRAGKAEVPGGEMRGRSKTRGGFLGE